MELIKGLADLIAVYGVTTIFTICVALFMWFKRDWLISTLQAAAIVKQHEQTISELREEIKQLREQLELYNKKLIEATDTIARLEERLDAAQNVAVKAVTKSRGRKPRTDETK
jgi:cell division protein FtsB